MSLPPQAAASGTLRDVTPTRRSTGVAARKDARLSEDLAWSADNWLALPFVLYELVFLFRDRLSHIVRSPLVLFALWLLLALTRLDLSRMRKTLRSQRMEIIAFAVWITVVLLNDLAGRGFIAWRHSASQFFSLFALFMALVYSSRMPGLLNGLRFGMLLALGLQASISISILLSQSGIARAVMVRSADPDLGFAIAHGIGAYSLYAALAIVLPTMLGVALSARGLLKALGLLACVAIFVSIILSTFTGASALAFVGLSMVLAATLFASKGALSRRLLLVVIAGGALWIVIAQLSSTRQWEFVSSKTLRIVEGVIQHGPVAGEVTGRGEYADISLRTFLAHPLIGVGPAFGVFHPVGAELVGGHSSWIDVLAEYGLLGFLPLLMFLVAIGRRLMREAVANRNVLSLSKFASFATFVLGGLVNPVIYSPPIMTLFIIVTLSGSSVTGATDVVSGTSRRFPRRAARIRVA